MSETKPKLSKSDKAIKALTSEDPKKTDKKVSKKTDKSVEKEEEVEEADLSLVVTKKADTLKYEKKTLHDQILLRPDTYIGSIRRVLTSEPVWYYDEKTKYFSKGFLQLNTGLLDRKSVV